MLTKIKFPINFLIKAPSNKF